MPTPARRRARAAAVAVPLAAALLTVAPPAAWAAFTDPVAATATVTAKVVAPPSALHCESISLLAGDLVWTASPDATSYTVIAPGGGTSVVGAGTTRVHFSLLSVGAWSVTTTHASGWRSVAATVVVTQVGGIAVCI